MNESITKKNSTYEKLTPQRKVLVDLILHNLENGTGLWKKGWKASGLPVSGITGKPYRGVNNVFLTIVAMTKHYEDNRWVTFHQMQERDWHFKTDEEGNSLGKGAGVSVEYFEFRDRETKKPFDKEVLNGLTTEEKEEYIRDNVYPLRKYYIVFNGDLIEGIPKKNSTKSMRVRRMNGQNTLFSFGIQPKHRLSMVEMKRFIYQALMKFICRNGKTSIPYRSIILPHCMKSGIVQDMRND